MFRHIRHEVGVGAQERDGHDRDPDLDQRRHHLLEKRHKHVRNAHVRIARDPALENVLEPGPGPVIPFGFPEFLGGRGLVLGGQRLFDRLFNPGFRIGILPGVRPLGYGHREVVGLPADFVSLGAVPVEELRLVGGLALEDIQSLFVEVLLNPRKQFRAMALGRVVSPVPLDVLKDHLAVHDPGLGHRPAQPELLFAIAVVLHMEILVPWHRWRLS